MQAVVHPGADPWSVAGATPPAEAGPRMRIELALHTALTAPSRGNAQPWRWFVGGELIELYLDPSRGLPEIDPDGQAALVACGAALGALRVALRVLGLAETTALLPGGHPDLLARVAVGGAAQAQPEEQWLYQAAPKRRTWRGVMAARSISRALLRRLGSMSQETGTEVHVVEDMARKTVIADVVEAALAVEPPAVAAARAAVGEGLATFEQEDGSPARGRAIADGSPALVIVTADGDGPADRLCAGQALMRVLLRARVDHAWASYLHAPLRDAAGRRDLARLVGSTGHAHALVRLGLGADTAPATRRPLSDVLLAQRPA